MDGEGAVKTERRRGARDRETKEGDCEKDCGEDWGPGDAGSGGDGNRSSMEEYREGEETERKR